MIVKFTDVDGNMLPIESSAFVAAESELNASNTSIILLSAGVQVRVRETTQEIYQRVADAQQTKGKKNA